jgi:hypothetical protein
MIREHVSINDDGTVTCACGTRLHFLPPELPKGGPNSVNHPGCPAADPQASPAGADMDGRYETINLLDRKAIEAFYKSHEWDPDNPQRVSALGHPPGRFVERKKTAKS